MFCGLFSSPDGLMMVTLVKDDKLTELVDQLVRRGIVGPGVIYHLHPGHYLMDRCPD